MEKTELLFKIPIRITALLLVFVFSVEDGIWPAISTATILQDAKDTAISSVNVMPAGQAEAEALKSDSFNKFSTPDQTKATLSQQCLQKNPDGTCSKYLINDNQNVGDITPGYNDAITNSGSVSGTYEGGLQAAQAKGSASDAYYQFYQGTAPFTQPCSSFGGWLCDANNRMYGSQGDCLNNCSNVNLPCEYACPYQSDTACAVDPPPSTDPIPKCTVNNIKMDCVLRCPVQSGTCSGDPPSCTVNGNCIDKTEQPNEYCRQSIDMRSDPIFGKGSSSNFILDNAYLDCTRKITPVYEDPGDVRSCDVDPADEEKLIEQGPCDVSNVEVITTENITTPCEKTYAASEDGQIYLTCKNYYTWYKVFDRRQTSSACPQSCTDFSGAYCYTPAVYQTTPPPEGSQFLGANYYNFIPGTTCTYSFDAWWLDTTTNTYYKNYISTATFPSPCPTSCTQFSGAYCSGPPTYSTAPAPSGSTYLGIEYGDLVTGTASCSYAVYLWYQDSGGTYYRNYFSSVGYALPANACPTTCEQVGDGLCTNFPETYNTGAPPGSAEYVGNSYENFSACSYDVYKWYRLFDHAEREKIVLNRTSSCEKTKLDDWVKTCLIKDYSICNPDGSGCVQIVSNQEPTGNVNKVCKNVTGTLKNYHICPNDGGASPAVEFPTGEPPTEAPLYLDDGSGEQTVTQTAVYKDEKGFANTIIWQTIYGGPGMRPNLNDWSAQVKFLCQQHVEVPPQCQPLVDAGCVYKDFECIDPPQPGTVPVGQNTVEDCKLYRYYYQCGPPNGKLLGYNVDYYCGSGTYHTYYDANEDFMAFATGIEILHQIQIDSDISDPNNIKIFPGEYHECQVSPNNCCTKLSAGISIGDYVKLGFALYKMYSLITKGFEGLVFETGTKLGGLFGGSITLTSSTTGAFQTGDIIVNSATGESYTVAQVSSNLTSAPTAFQEEIDALSGICSDGTTTVGQAAVAINDTLYTVATIIQIIAIVVAIYSIVNFVYNLAFQCTYNDKMTGIQLGQARCIYKGKRCAKKLPIIGCIKSKNKYCCYHSLLARIIHEQGEPQIGLDTGDSCRGFTPDELAMIDFSQIDLSEYMQYLEGEYKKEYSDEELANMQSGVVNNLPNRQQVIEDRFRRFYKPP